MTLLPRAAGEVAESAKAGGGEQPPAREQHLKYSFFLALLTICLAMASCANDSQDRLAATEVGPIPDPPPLSTPLPAPDPARGKPVAWLKDHYIYSSDLGQAGLDSLIISTLFTDYVREQRIEPTKAQLQSHQRWMKKAHDKDPQPRPKNQGVLDTLLDKMFGKALEDSFDHVFTNAMVTQWLLDKSLYEKYGGRVIFQQANPSEPVGAYRAFLQSHERRGTFRIFDAADRAAFWKYYTTRHSMELTKDQIDFSKPWWEKPTGPN